jgi:hypothetical protein
VSAIAIAIENDRAFQSALFTRPNIRITMGIKTEKEINIGLKKILQFW